MMKDGIDIRVSPSIDPQTLTGIDGYTEETAGFVGEAYSAFNDAYITLSKIHDAADLWRNNPAVTPENATLIVSKEAAKHQDRLLRKMDGAARTLQANIAHTEGELSRPLEARALGTLNAEIRTHARSLDREGRSKLIREAMEADDDTTLASILAVPAYLSGLSQVDCDHYVHQYHSKKNPHLVARLTVMRGALEKVERDGRLIIKEMRKAIGADAKQVQAIDKADTAARAALKIEPTA
jgi:hypothetical protein